jgi:hypothetical protein
MHLSGDIKSGGLSAAQQQGVFFNQQTNQQSNQQQSQTQAQPQQQQQQQHSGNHFVNNSNNACNGNNPGNNPANATNNLPQLAQQQSSSLQSQSLSNATPPTSTQGSFKSPSSAVACFFMSCYSFLTGCPVVSFLEIL